MMTGSNNKECILICVFTCNCVYVHY